MDQITQICNQTYDKFSSVLEAIQKHLSLYRHVCLYVFYFCVILTLNSCVTTTNSNLESNPPAISNAGSYLKGRVAYNNHDLKNAVLSFRSALKKNPNDNLLQRRSFIAELESGNLKQAIKLAELASKQQKSSLFMKLVIGLQKAKQTKWDQALENFGEMEASQINEVLKPLLHGWSYLAKKDFVNARQSFLGLQKKRGFELLSLLHTALAFQNHDSTATLDKLLDQAIKQAQQPPARLLLATANYYHKTGRINKANYFLKKIKSDEYNLDLLRTILKDPSGPGLSEVDVDLPADGIAEALFDLATALRDDYKNHASLIFVRLAIYMRPNFTSAQILLGELLEERSKYRQAIQEFDKISEKSIFYQMAQFRLSRTLKQFNKPYAAIRIIEGLQRLQPMHPENFIRLGDIHRSQKNWDKAIAAYNTAINLASENKKTDWILYYSRGVAFEQSKKWDLAEADFIKALELSPDQPFVMNYLGYAWTEQGINLTKAEKLIRKAANLRPKDGYITDSLGWILYQTARFAEAVPILERAVRLRPNDAIINDHLGDAYWKVERHLEAVYQWRRAITMNPDAELKEKIDKKLSFGLK